jgi:hypothetical protein
MTFIVWAGIMLLVLLVMVMISHRSKPVTDAAEDAASAALPLIGKIAETEHQRRFGRAPTSVPRRNGNRTSWYPPTRKKLANRT